MVRIRCGHVRLGFWSPAFPAQHQSRSGLTRQSTIPRSPPTVIMLRVEHCVNGLNQVAHISSGFDNTASTPSADINDGVIFELYIVNMMIRTSGLVFFICLRIEVESILQILPSTARLRYKSAHG